MKTSTHGSRRWPTPKSPAATAIGKANGWRDTRPELELRSLLHRSGLRYRTSYTIRLGERRWTRPDIAFTRAKVAVYVDGCFWHACPEHLHLPKHNRVYWIAKLENNVVRDRDTDARLAAMGWSVVRAWEHEKAGDVAPRVLAVLQSQAAATARADSKSTSGMGVSSRHVKDTGLDPCEET